MSSHESRGLRMFANGTCDSKGLPRPLSGIAATRVKRSFKPSLPEQNQDSLEITDTPSSRSSSNPPLVQRPVVEKSRKLSGTSPIVIPSSLEPNSPEPQQPRKRKAAALPAPYVCKKRGQEIRPTNAREKGKGAAVRGTHIKKITTAADPVDSSDDEINVRGEDVRKEDAIEQPKPPRPKPHLKKPGVKIPAKNDVFQDIEEPASSDLEEMISTSLRKRLEGPTDIPEAPPSPSPRLDPTLPPPLPLEQTSLPLPPEEKARPTPVLLNAPLLEPPTVGNPTIPTPVPPPHRQEMPSIHLHAPLNPQLTSGDFYQMHPPVNMNNYYPHSNYNQHAAYPPYYGAPHAPVPPSGPHAPMPPSMRLPHMPVPSPTSHMPNLPPAVQVPVQHPAPCAPISDPRGYHDTGNPYPRATYQYPGMFRAPNDGSTAGGYPVHDSTIIGMSYQHTGPPDAPQSALPTLPPAPGT
ncbi:hypothetical protein J3R83DRAFT_2436 [Lanmaoa asiatica]|nr:hypothetical protein J3R83DRAFT_2436 [Lanmaoa asiatica]